MSGRTPAKRATNGGAAAGSAKKPTPEKRAQATPSLKKTAKKLQFDDGSGDEREKETVKFLDFGDDFKDELGAVSEAAIHNYFMQGKAVKMNRGRGRRGKMSKRGDGVIDRNVEEEMEEEEEGGGEAKEDYANCDLPALRDYFQVADELLSTVAPSVATRVERVEEEEFPRWTAYLYFGFNLLVHGCGSKRELLAAFARDELDKLNTMVVDGFREEANVKSLLAAIDSNMKLNCPAARRSPAEWAKALGERLDRQGEQLYLIFHNIDGVNFRDPSEQNVLRILAESASIRFVASIDHINATMLWNTRTLDSFNWAWLEVNTFRQPEQELLAGQSRLLGLSAKCSSSGSAHSLASLDVLWQSLCANSHKIFRLLFSTAFNGDGSVSFWDLFAKCKEEFLVSTDTALRQQLVEFVDHRLVRWMKGSDLNEKLAPALDRGLVEKFLESKGLSLDE